MLALLWSLFPGHPNLLPAYYDDPIYSEQVGVPSEAKWVSKPLFGREGLGVFVSSNYSSYEQFVDVTETNFGFDA